MNDRRFCFLRRPLVTRDDNKRRNNVCRGCPSLILVSVYVRTTTTEARCTDRRSRFEWLAKGAYDDLELLCAARC